MYYLPVIIKKISSSAVLVIGVILSLFLFALLFAWLLWLFIKLLFFVFLRKIRSEPRKSPSLVMLFMILYSSKLRLKFFLVSIFIFFLLFLAIYFVVFIQAGNRMVAMLANDQLFFMIYCQTVRTRLIRKKRGICSGKSASIQVNSSSLPGKELVYFISGDIAEK